MTRKSSIEIVTEQRTDQKPCVVLINGSGATLVDVQVCHMQYSYWVGEETL